jgi:hypothetical protein
MDIDQLARLGLFYFMNSQLATMILEIHCRAWVWIAGSLSPIIRRAISLPNIGKQRGGKVKRGEEAR